AAGSGDPFPLSLRSRGTKLCGGEIKKDFSPVERQWNGGVRPKAGRGRERSEPANQLSRVAVEPVDPDDAASLGSVVPPSRNGPRRLRSRTSTPRTPYRAGTGHAGRRIPTRSGGSRPPRPP